MAIKWKINLTKMNNENSPFKKSKQLKATTSTTLLGGNKVAGRKLDPKECSNAVIIKIISTLQ